MGGVEEDGREHREKLHPLVAVLDGDLGEGDARGGGVAGG